MADTDSNIVNAIRPSSSLNSKDALDKAQIKIEHIRGTLDCLYTLTCKTSDNDLGLCEGSLSSTLDLLMYQVTEAQRLLNEVRSSCG